MNLSDKRKNEHEKYQRAYKLPSYGMGVNRRKSAQKYLFDLPFRGSYLDVGCGRGEMLRYAESIGFDPVTGVDVVDYLLGTPSRRAASVDLMNVVIAPS